MTLNGAREFRNRLDAIRDTGVVVAQHWTEEGVRDMRGVVPRVTGATADSIHGEVSRDSGQILGSRVVGYLAHGTRAHSEVPTQAQALRFQVGGRTIFSKRVLHPPTTGNPRILDAAKNALTGMAAVCRELWNRAG